MKSFATLLITVFSLLVSTMADKSAYVGRWKFLETYDESMQPVDLPEGEFYLELKENDDESLNAYIKVGNNMRSKITFTGESASGDAISVGGLMSTMMMPPEPLFRLETYLSNTLPKMTLIEKQTVNDATQLVFSGLGKIVFEEAGDVPES